MRGVARFGSAASSATPVDPLAYLDDTFGGVGLDPKWQIYKPAALASAIVGGGYLEIQIVQGGPGATGSFWFDDNDGVQIYQLVTGDFIAEMHVEILDAAGGGPPPLGDFNVGILQARDPAGAPLPTGFSYVHKGPAANATADFNSECKSTVLSVSTFDYVVEASTAQWVQCTRIGQVFSFAYKVNASDPWIPRTSYNRAANPLPNVVALGPGLYTNAAPSDLSGRYRDFTVRTPP